MIGGPDQVGTGGLPFAGGRAAGPHTEEISVSQVESSGVRPLLSPISIEPEALDMADIDLEEVDVFEDAIELPNVEATIAGGAHHLATPPVTAGEG